MVTIEGPRFSTRAESNLFRSWGCELVNMTTVPEVSLAKELGLCYASIALPTDYDCWKGQPVRYASLVLRNFENLQFYSFKVSEAAMKVIST